MSNPVITVKGLSKRYTLRHQERNGTLRDQLVSLLRNSFRRTKGARNTQEEFWALRDVNFTINQGEVVGIIGRNGAGKSTLLKILSRITEPTAGRITIQGRIASLLEVGTGFHGELSGRENIFLNGAILGMTRREIRSKFDEIVAFSEVEKFLDTPVKHYSSGMYVRLAFAVAAHLEPEILIVDEVLAVGDADFQRKCLRKMDDVTRRDGRTILFVSHQLQAVRQLCGRVIVLDRGRLVTDATTQLGLDAYGVLSAQGEVTSVSRTLVSSLVLNSFEFYPIPVKVFDDLRFSLAFTASEECSVHDLCILIYTSNGQRAGVADLRNAAMSYKLKLGEKMTLHGIFSRIALVPGRYSAGLFLKTNLSCGDYLDLQQFEVQQDATNTLISYASEHLGLVALDAHFSAASETR